MYFQTNAFLPSAKYCSRREKCQQLQGNVNHEIYMYSQSWAKNLHKQIFVQEKSFWAALKFPSLFRVAEKRLTLACPRLWSSLQSRNAHEYSESLIPTLTHSLCTKAADHSALKLGYIFLIPDRWTTATFHDSVLSVLLYSGVSTLTHSLSCSVYRSLVRSSISPCSVGYSPHDFQPPVTGFSPGLTFCVIVVSQPINVATWCARWRHPFSCNFTQT